jgi:hypothetical protein
VIFGPAGLAANDTHATFAGRSTFFGQLGLRLAVHLTNGAGPSSFFVTIGRGAAANQCPDAGRYIFSADDAIVHLLPTNRVRIGTFSDEHATPGLLPISALRLVAFSDRSSIPFMSPRPKVPTDPPSQTGTPNSSCHPAELCGRSPSRLTRHRSRAIHGRPAVSHHSSEHAIQKAATSSRLRIAISRSTHA